MGVEYEQLVLHVAGLGWYLGQDVSNHDYSYGLNVMPFL